MDANRILFTILVFPLLTDAKQEYHGTEALRKPKSVWVESIILRK